MVVSTVCDQLSICPTWHIGLRGPQEIKRSWNDDVEMSVEYVENTKHGTGHLIDVLNGDYIPTVILNHLLSMNRGGRIDFIGNPKSGKTTLLLLLGVALSRREWQRVLFITDAPYSLANLSGKNGWDVATTENDLQQTVLQCKTMVNDYIWIPPNREEFLSYAPGIVLVDCTDTVNSQDSDYLRGIISLCEEVGCTYCISQQARRGTYMFGNKIFMCTKGEQQQ